MSRKISSLVSFVLSVLVLLGSVSLGYARETINVYTSRHYGVEAVFEQFTKDTGIMVRFTSGGDAALRERIKAEGRNTLADVYIGSDAANLVLAAKDGLLKPTKSRVIEKNIPAHLRDNDNRWVALTKRVRTIMYNPAKVKPEELSTYEDLADSKWRGRLILRPATHPYTQALVAGIIAADGEARAEEIVRGWVANAAKYIDSDSKILEALVAGDGDVAITNTYYLGRLLETKPGFPVRSFWANQDKNGRGVHINISGAGVTTHAINAKNAVRFIEWLSSPKGQKMFSDMNHEYPANPAVAPHKVIEGLGKFREDSLSLADLGRLHAETIKLLERAGYK